MVPKCFGRAPRMAAVVAWCRAVNVSRWPIEELIIGGCVFRVENGIPKRFRVSTMGPNFGPGARSSGSRSRVSRRIVVAPMPLARKCSRLGIRMERTAPGCVNYCIVGVVIAIRRDFGQAPQGHRARGAACGEALRAGDSSTSLSMPAPRPRGSSKLAASISSIWSCAGSSRAGGNTGSGLA